MRDILAIDLATTTGWARGSVGDATPSFGTQKFYGGISGKSQDGNAVFAASLKWITETLANNPPDMVIMESLLPPAAMLNQTSRAVRDRLAGLHGVIRAAARRRGIGEISDVGVGDVRQHFIGTRSLKRDEAKKAVIDQCLLLDWRINNDNEADACAIWSFAVSLIDPKQALRVSPLFNRKLRAVSWP